MMEYIKKHKEIFKTISVILFLFILTFLILLLSPTNIWQKGFIFRDQGVFETIAMMMKNNFMPYKDTFDHKGPLIYIYNYLGLSIQYYKGIWYIEFINLFISLLFFYKTARLKCNKLFSAIIVFISTATIVKFFDEGNLTEEFAIPFIAIALYIFLDYLLNKKITKTRLIACGFSLGGVLLLRPNMISVWIVFCIAILYECIKEKKYKDLKEFIICFLLGMMIIIVPIIIWLGINNALIDFWKDYVIFNFKYTKVSEYGIGISAKLVVFLYFLGYFLVLYSLIFSIVLYKLEKKRLYLYYAVYTIITVILVSISGNLYLHYGLILSPLPVFLIASSISNKKIKSLSKIMIIAFSAISLLNYIHIIKVIPNIYKYGDSLLENNYFSETIKIIKNNTDKNDSISVYGSLDTLYVLSERKHATKYSYIYPIYNVDTSIKKEYFSQLEKEKPKIIIVDNSLADEEIISFLEKNNYENIYQTEDLEDNYYTLYKLGIE